MFRIAAISRFLRTTVTAYAAFILSSEPLMAVHFEPLGADRGMDAQVITALQVDQRGFLWAGTREGLFRYDGYRAVRFIPEAGNPDSITDADIRMVYEDPRGILWVATNNGGLNRYDPESGHFRAYRHDSARPDSLSNDSIYGMADAGGGKLWVGTQIGLNLLDTETGSAERFLHDPERPDSLSHDYVYAVFVDRSGSAWITTIGGGVNRWVPSRKGFERFDFASLLGGDPALNDVFTVTETAEGALLFGTRNGVVRLDPETLHLERFGIGAETGSNAVITASLEDAQGRIWLTELSSGVYRFDPDTGAISPVDTRPLGGREQLPAVPMLSLALSGDLLFVGTWGSGIYAGQIDSPPFSILRAGSPGRPEREGLRDRNVMAILPTATPGRPYVGMFGGGLQQVDAAEGQALQGLEAMAGTAAYGVFSMTQTTDGRLFAATTQGLLEADPAREVITLHQNEPGNTRSIGAGYVTTLLSDESGGLWVGVGGSGLYYLPRVADVAGGGGFTSFRHDPARPDSLSDDYVTALWQTDPATLWVGTRSQGLNHCRIASFSCTRYLPDPAQPGGLGHFHVTDLFQDRQGFLWVSTDGGGINRIELSAQGEVAAFSRWTSKDGLISDAAVSMVQDDDSSLWIATRAGLSRLDPATRRFANFVAHSGLPSAHFNVSAAARDSDFLYFGSVDGLLSIRAGTPFAVHPPSRISLSNFEIPTGGAKGSPARGLPSSHTMPWGDVVSVGFSVLDFAEIPHQYEYQVGDSDEWISLGSKQDVTFFGLAPGYHKLRTRGRDVYGSWSEAKPFNIIVIPPFWMTTWFRVLATLAVIALVTGAHLARTRALQRRNAELVRLKTQREQALESAHESGKKLTEAYEGLRGLTSRLESAKEVERQTISRELHDELGQMLTAAKLNLQMARKDAGGPQLLARLDDSIALLDNMIRQVRDISRSLRPPLLDEAGLVPALQHHLAGLQQRSGVKITLEAEVETTFANPAVNTVVFRVVQEAVNNALRHAGAAEIRVALRVVDNELLVSVEDDGRGFDLDETQHRIRRGEHLGLLGMTERVRGAGGQFDLTASPGRGSRIEVKLPL